MKTRSEQLEQEIKKEIERIKPTNINQMHDIHNNVSSRLYSKWVREDAEKMTDRELLIQIYCKLAK